MTRGDFSDERNEDVTNMPIGAPSTVEDWRAYLPEYGEVFVRTADEYVRQHLTAEQIETHWLGADPANEGTIAATQQRLGLELPPSLRTFLTVTDGWKGVGGWIDEVVPCAEIDWMRNTDKGAGLVELYTDAENDEDEPNELLALFQRAVVVAVGEDLWLLDPTEAHPDGEWPAHEFEPKYGEAEEYRSFADLFHASKELMLEFEEDS